MKRKKIQLKECSKRVIVIYGDTHGFSNWTRRRPEGFLEYMTAMNNEIHAFCEPYPFILKGLGDGFMAVLEVTNDKGPLLAYSVLKDAVLFTKKINRIIYNLDYPRPYGFRTRLVYGKAFKITDIIENRYDYAGYVINLGSKILNIQPKKQLVCHESVIDLLRPSHKRQFKFKKLDKPDRSKGSDDSLPRGGRF